MSGAQHTPGPWSFDPDTNDISLKGCPIFRVYRESDFPCIEEEDRPEADAEYIALAYLVITLLNAAVAAKEAGDRP